MNHRDFSRSLSVSTDTSQLTQDKVIKELIQEVIKNNMGKNSPYMGFTENDRLFKILKAQLLRFLEFKGMKLDSKNKKEIKALLEEFAIEHDQYYLPSQDDSEYCNVKCFKFDFTEHPDLCRAWIGENVSFYAKKCDNGKFEYLTETEEWRRTESGPDYYRWKTINIYDERGMQISTIYVEDLPCYQWRYRIYFIERDLSSISGLYSLKYKEVMGVFGHLLQPSKKGIVYETTEEVSLEMPEGDPSVIPSFKEVLKPIIEGKIKKQKDNPNKGEQIQGSDSQKRIKKDYIKYPSIREYAEEMCGKKAFKEERQ